MIAHCVEICLLFGSNRTLDVDSQSSSDEIRFNLTIQTKINASNVFFLLHSK